MSYDLTRLRRKQLVRRLPRTNTYVLTSDGARFALFTPRSTTGSRSCCWSPTPRPPRLSCATRSGSSTSPWATTSAQPGYDGPPETLENPQTRNHQGSLRRFRAKSRNRGPSEAAMSNWFPGVLLHGPGISAHEAPSLRLLVEQPAGHHGHREWEVRPVL